LKEAKMAVDRLRKKIGKGRHHSALKRQRQNKRRHARNRTVMSSLRTAMKNVRTARSKEALAKAIPEIDKAANKGVIPKARASRIVSRLTRFVAAA
jgi:small subunit ribosomal protein S20